MTLEQRREILSNLENPEYRREFVSEHVSTGLAFQIRALREARVGTQERLGELIGTAQEAISKLESPDYGRYSLTTLKKLAAAFDVALLVRFVPFTELVEWTIGLTPERLTPPSYDEERKQVIVPSMILPRMPYADVTASPPDPYSTLANLLQENPAWSLNTAMGSVPYAPHPRRQERGRVLIGGAT